MSAHRQVSSWGAVNLCSLQRSQRQQLFSAVTNTAVLLSAHKYGSFAQRSLSQQLFSALAKTAALLSAHKYSSFSLLSQRRQLSSALMHRQVSSRSARKTGLLLAALTKKEGPVSAETTQTIMSTAQFSCYGPQLPLL